MKRYTVEFEPYSHEEASYSVSWKGMSITLDAQSPEAARLEALLMTQKEGRPDAKIKSVKEATHD